MGLLCHQQHCYYWKKNHHRTGEILVFLSRKTAIKMRKDITSKFALFYDISLKIN